MTKNEISEFASAIIGFERKILKSKKSARVYLMKAGVLTKSGNLTKEYKKLVGQ